MILGGAGDIHSSISTANYCNGPYIPLLLCANKVRGACTEVWTATCRSSKRFWFPGVVLGRFIFEIFEILGGAGDINNSTSMTNYCNGPHGDLGVYVDKVLSAWTEVWTGTWPSRASIMAPGCRDLGRFLSFWAGW